MVGIRWNKRVLVALSCLGAGLVAATSLVAARDDFRWRSGGGSAQAGEAAPGTVLDQGSDAIRWTKFRGGLSALATDGSGVWYAAGAGDEVALYKIQPPLAEAVVVASLTWDEFPQWIGRSGDTTVLMTGLAVVAVRDDGTKEAVALPPVTLSDGRSPNGVEGTTVGDGVLYLVRFGALEVDRFALSPKLRWLPPIPLPKGVPPLQSVRALADGRLLLAAHRSNAEKGYNPGMWVMDVGTGEATAVSGANAPFGLSQTGALVFNNDGSVARFEESTTSANAISTSAIPAGPLAATPDGDFWHIGFKEAGISFTTVAGRTTTFDLPVVVLYVKGPPDGSSPGRTRLDKPVGVTSMVALNDGSVVFTIAELPWLGFIPRPN